jgi:hypothetical protein
MMTYDQWKPSVDLLIRHGADVTKALVEATARSAGPGLRITLFVMTDDHASWSKREGNFPASMIQAFDRLIETWIAFIECGINLNVQIGDSTLWQTLLDSLAWTMTAQHVRTVLEAHCAQLMTLFIENGADPYLAPQVPGVHSISDLSARVSEPQQNKILQKALHDAEDRWNLRYSRRRAGPPIEEKPSSNKRRRKQAPTAFPRPKSFAASAQPRSKRRKT